MNKKQLTIICGIGLSALMVIAIVSMYMLEDKPKSSLSAEEINALDDDKFDWTLDATKERID